MAWLEKRNTGYRICFRHGGQGFQCRLGEITERAARAQMGRLEDNLMLLERGKLHPPSGADLGLFLLSDGQLNERLTVAKCLRLGEFLQKYRECLTNAKEASTQTTELVHMAHVERLLGSRTIVQGITLQTLQGYVDQRSRELWRKQPVSPTTVKKEIGTFTSIWNRWGVPQGLVNGPALSRGLVYGKAHTAPPFQTWKQIERTIARGGLIDAEKYELWDCLFLSTEELTALLLHVQRADCAAYTYPMFAFAAHTGARRSEMIRSQLDDLDFDGNQIKIREKKKDTRRELTYRHVPMSGFLRGVLEKWLTAHPGGQPTFCQREATPLTSEMVAHQFRRAVRESKWDVLHGWHLLRHSFASNCAAAGVEQRVIDAWMGHQTNEMSSRYRHMFPNREAAAIASVFG